MLRLNDDRTIDVKFDDGTEVRLRPPTIAEWRKIRDAYLTADRDWQAKQEEYLDSDGEGPEPVIADYVWSDANPYGAAFALVVAELSSMTPDADRLPMWTAHGKLYAVMHDHWRTVPLVDARHVEPVPEAEPPFDPVAAGLAPTPEPTPVPAPAPAGRPMPAAVQGFLDQQSGQVVTGGTG